MWDARKGHPLTEPLKHDDSVFRVQFSPAGDRIVTASADGTARIWDGLTGQPLTEPLRHQGLVHCVQFSPDGERVVTASNDQTARVWEVPKPPLPIPSWVADLAEAVAGQRVNHAGISEPTSVTNLSKIGRRLEAPSGSDFWSRWATWFLREHATRTISPFSPVSVSEYVRRRIEEGTLTSLREAARLSRTNDQVLVRLARELMAQRSDPGFRNLREADLLVRRACQFAPSNHAAWGTRAEILAARQKPHEAQLAILRALELIELEKFPGQETLRSTYQATRRQIHSQLNRPSEAKDK
ncbi:MAG: WD40 repeat domain-containing protein [Verrucomicrobia bacterium]|nr:WD40 repeat domain-containing protein [Verrucomicrobiota bacterium]